MTRWGRIALILGAIVVGIPLATLLVAGTSGVVVVPIVTAAVAAPLFALHYFLWGRSAVRRLTVQESNRAENACPQQPAS